MKIKNCHPKIEDGIDLRLFPLMRHRTGRRFFLTFQKQSAHGDMASDLYGPQFWDDNFQFSFSVVVSCKSNKQLGYF